MGRLIVTAAPVFALFAAASAEARVIPCSELNANNNGNPLVIEVEHRDSLEANCEVELKQDLSLVAKSGHADFFLMTDTATHFGLKIDADGHSLLLRDLRISFKTGARGALYVFDDDDSPASRGDVDMSNVDFVDQTRDTIAPNQQCPTDKRFGVVLRSVGPVELDHVNVWGPEEGENHKAPPLQVGLLVSDAHHATNRPSTRIVDSKFFVSCGLPMLSARRRAELRDVLVEAKGPCDWRPSPLSEFVPQNQ